MKSRHDLVFLGLLCIAALPSTGIPQGISLVKDIVAGTGSSQPYQFVQFEGKLIFGAQRELWETDGTPAGTLLLKDLNTATGSAPADFVVQGSELFFVANGTGIGRELYVTDGTAAGTKPVKDIVSGTGSPDIRNLTAMRSRVVFSADDGKSGREVWWSDGGNAGLIKDAMPGAGDGVNAATGFTAIGGLVFYTGRDKDHGWELFVTNGSAAGMVKDIYSGSGSSSPSAGVAYRGRYWFSAYQPGTGHELWVSDGTSAGTTMVADLNQGAGNSAPTDFIATGDKLFFEANDGSGLGLFVVHHDGKPVKLKSPFQLAGSSLSGQTGVGYGAGAIFYGNDGTNGAEPWFSDGTTANTFMLADISSGSRHSTPQEFTQVGDRVYFAATSNISGQELWETDGTKTGTKLVQDLAAGSRSSTPRHLTVLGGGSAFCRLFFAATHPIYGREVFVLSSASPTPITVRLSIKRVRNRLDQYDPAWTDANIRTMVNGVSSIWRRHANVIFELDEIVDLTEPGSPSRWYVVDHKRKRMYEEAAESKPCRFKWRTDAVNVYLVANLGAGGVCSFPACPADDNDIIFLSPNVLNGTAYGLAHELGHYLDLRHTHANHEPARCGCYGGGGGDCVADTPPDANPAACDNSPTPTLCHEQNLKALGYPSRLYNLLRYNVMSYHGPSSLTQAVLSCGQVSRAREALRGPRRNVVKGNPVVQITSVSPFGPMYPGPTSLTVRGQNFPAAVAVRAGDQTDPSVPTNGSAAVAYYGKNVSPGVHCVSLLERGNVIAFKSAGIEVTPHMTTSMTGGTGGRVSIAIRSTASRAQMILALGIANTPITVPGVTHSLNILPLSLTWITTNVAGTWTISDSLSRFPASFTLHVQAVELRSSQLLAFTNVIQILVR